MSMQSKVQALQNIVSRKGSSKVLTFSVPHVFKALQMLHLDRFVSRSMFCSQLHMGEGAVKTMIAHLKEESFANSTKSGTFLTSKGKNFVKSLYEVMPFEYAIKKSQIAPGKFNYGVILKRYSTATKSGMEQRDYAVLYGANGATTIQYKDDKFETTFDICYMTQRYDEAISFFRGWRDPPIHMYWELAAAYAQLDRMEEARAAVAEYEKRKPDGYDFAVALQTQLRMCARAEDADRWREGYRKAGLPA